MHFHRTDSLRSWLVRYVSVATALILAAPGVYAAVEARTDLATISVAPIARQVNATTGWRTIYDYSGGDAPPGTRIIADGKWLDPLVRQDASGVTYAFPALPDQPQAAQFLRSRFSIERPLANYPTRVTVKFTLRAEQTLNQLVAPWTVLSLATSDLTYYQLFSLLSSDPVNLHGPNELVFSLDGSGNGTVTVNGKPVAGDLSKRIQLKKPGALLLPGISVAAGLVQLPQDKGDWYSLNGMRIEQNRPPLEASSTAALDLTVPGTAPVRTSIEVVDGKNASVGFVLRDAVVAPGRYHLFWDGTNQRTSQPQGAVPLATGSYTFRLTTSRTQVRCIGEVNNSVPRYNPESYAQVNCTALALTPPGTGTPGRVLSAFPDPNRRPDTRPLDTTDSVQLVCSGYDSHLGQWIGADGSVFHTRTGDSRMQNGRGVAITPPDPAEPKNPQKQAYFVSTSIFSAQGVVTGNLPGSSKATPKVFTSPDWNRTRGFSPYTIQIGRVAELLGPQHYLFLKMGWRDGQTKAEWLFRNIRLYEAGAPDPGPIHFDSARFTARLPLTKGQGAGPIPAGTLMIEDEGRAIRLKNAASVNYPLEYTVTPRTVLAFDLNVIDRGNANFGAGIGLDADPAAKNALGYHGYFNFLPGDLRWGFQDPGIGAYPFPDYQPNTLYTETIPPPAPAGEGIKTKFLFQPGFYGLKISEDGKLLFACNNADNRLEVRDIAGDGRAIAKIPIACPMYVALAPAGAAGAPNGVRYVFVDSHEAGLLRIGWRTADNTFGPPQTLLPATEFAYPRGLVYDSVSHRIFLCDSFSPDRKRAANQIAVIDPVNGKVLTRFGKPGGVDPRTGGLIGDDVFTCPLTIEADSKGALWVNDYYTAEVRKYRYNAATGTFALERRVLGPNTTNIAHFYWLPGAPPTQVWTVADHFVRHEAEFGADGTFTNQHVSGARLQIDTAPLRPYAHFSNVSSRIYATFGGQGDIFEQVGQGWERRVTFGTGAGEAARRAGLIEAPGQPPSELSQAITAAGDAQWEKRVWVWSDLNGDGQIQYSAANPEFKIAFNSDLTANWNGAAVSGWVRVEDGAYVYPTAQGIATVVPKLVNGHASYDWKDATLLHSAVAPPVVDVVGQAGSYYLLHSSTNRHDVGAAVLSGLESYDANGRLAWSRGQSDYSLVSLEPVGDGLISTLERSFFNGLVSIRTTSGDLVCQVLCKDPGDVWSQGTLRADADTAYIGLAQAYKVTGLSTVKTAMVAVDLSGG